MKKIIWRLLIVHLAIITYLLNALLLSNIEIKFSSLIQKMQMYIYSRFRFFINAHPNIPASQKPSQLFVLTLIELISQDIVVHLLPHTLAGHHVYTEHNDFCLPALVLSPTCTHTHRKKIKIDDVQRDAMWHISGSMVTSFCH